MSGAFERHYYARNIDYVFVLENKMLSLSSNDIDKSAGRIFAFMLFKKLRLWSQEHRFMFCVEESHRSLFPAGMVV